MIRLAILTVAVLVITPAVRAAAPLDADGLRSVLVKGVAPIAPPVFPLAVSIPTVVEEDPLAVVPANAVGPIPTPAAPKLFIPPGGGPAIAQPAGGAKAAPSDEPRDPKKGPDNRRRRFSLR